MLKFPKGKVFQCQELKEGFGFKHKCLSAEFRIYKDGRVVCAKCGKEHGVVQISILFNLSKG